MPPLPDDVAQQRYLLEAYFDGAGAILGLDRHAIGTGRRLLAGGQRETVGVPLDLRWTKFIE